MQQVLIANSLYKLLLIATDSESAQKHQSQLNLRSEQLSTNRQKSTSYQRLTPDNIYSIATGKSDRLSEGRISIN